MNLWHDIDPGKSGDITTIIEIPKGSKNKYEIDKKSGLIALDRVMHTGQDYPFDYGFIPQTLCDDGDALDVVLLTTYPLFPGILVKVREVAIMNMVDGGEGDEKIIAVPVEDPRFAHVQDIKDINQHTLKEIEHFFLTYKQIQKKEVVINGWGDKEEAKKAFDRSLKLYKDRFSSK
jgi:inorganic pyrophosphatase